MHPTPIQISESTPVHRMYMFKKLGMRYCLVTTFGQLKGIITKKDLWKYLDQMHQEKRRRRESIEPSLPDDNCCRRCWHRVRMFCFCDPLPPPPDPEHAVPDRAQSSADIRADPTLSHI